MKCLPSFSHNVRCRSCIRHWKTKEDLFHCLIDLEPAVSNDLILVKTLLLSNISLSFRVVFRHPCPKKKLSYSEVSVNIMLNLEIFALCLPVRQKWCWPSFEHKPSKCKKPKEAFPIRAVCKEANNSVNFTGYGVYQALRDINFPHLPRLITSQFIWTHYIRTAPANQLSASASYASIATIHLSSSTKLNSRNSNDLRNESTF